jgi:hypothetical protein
MYDAGCGYNELKAVFGIKTKAKIRPLERELESVLTRYLIGWINEKHIKNINVKSCYFPLVYPSYS